jgi:hypothetical protein
LNLLVSGIPAASGNRFVENDPIQLPLIQVSGVWSESRGKGAQLEGVTAVKEDSLAVHEMEVREGRIKKIRILGCSPKDRATLDGAGC